MLQWEMVQIIIWITERDKSSAPKLLTSRVQDVKQANGAAYVTTNWELVCSDVLREKQQNGF